MGMGLVSAATQCQTRFRRLHDLIESFICGLQALWTWITHLCTPRTPELSSGPPVLVDREKGWPVVDVYQTRASLIDALKRRDAADIAFEAQVAALLDPVRRRLAEITRDRGVSHWQDVSCHTEPSTLDAEPAMDFPPAPQIFYGRARELDALVDMLVQPRRACVALLGEAGAGTSTLALALLHRPEIAQAFGSRRFLVRSSGTLAAAFGFAPYTPRSAVLATLAACPRRMLVVLDDLPDHEPLLAALECMPYVSFLLTAHSPMELTSDSGCTTLSIGPLPLPAARTLFRAIADLPAGAYDHSNDARFVDVSVPPPFAVASDPAFPLVDLSPFETPPAPNSDVAIVDALLKRTRYLPRGIVHLAQRAQYEPLPFLLASCVEEGNSAT
ncbi:hypothetical protein B0H12DRAFT_1146593 [Mycena haematopus]|nr:hypothetical protein B0H12DRAFT_1146593 [Mycena haematopus]